MSAISKKVIENLSDKEFRDTYVRARVRTMITYQVRWLRKRRGWLQGKFAQVLGKPQSTVSRFEDPQYGKLTLETLFQIASAFDVALVIQFVSFPEFLRRTRDVSPEALSADSFDEKQLLPLQSGVTLVANAAPSVSADIARYEGGDTAYIAKPLSWNEGKMVQ